MACTQQMVVNRHVNGNFDVKYGKIWDHTLQSIFGEQNQLGAVISATCFIGGFTG